MRLTFEEASIVRELIVQFPASVPREFLTTALCQGRLERVARMCSRYHHMKLPGAVEFYVLALIKSGTYQDIALAKRLLEDAHGGTSFLDPDSYIAAARWISRFDLSSPRSKDEDLGHRLHVMAKLTQLLEEKGIRRDRIFEFQAILKKGIENGMSRSDSRAFMAMYWVRNQCHELAFETLIRGLGEDSNHPYLRMTAHELFSAVPEEKRLDVLLYGGESGPVSYGISAVHGSGYLCKEYTGEGYTRNELGDQVDTNYSEVILLGREATNNLKFSLFPKGKATITKVTPLDANWGKWLTEIIGARDLKAA